MYSNAHTYQVNSNGIKEPSALDIKSLNSWAPGESNYFFKNCFYKQLQKKIHVHISGLQFSYYRIVGIISQRIVR